MATFTTFEDSALERYLVMFGVGELTRVEPISAGIENSNYFVTTTDLGEEQTFVLTILEGFGFDDVPFFNSVTSHLSHYGLPVPTARRTLDGMSMTIFCGKPATLVPKLDGEHLSNVEAEHCRAIGKALAEIHSVLSTKNDLDRSNPFDSIWQSETIASLSGHLSEDDRLLLNQVTTEYAELESLSLPRGIIHGDLFRDNALFNGSTLTGVIDFYHACTDFFVQDIAICLNDWCRDGALMSVGLVDAFLTGYESARELEPEERNYLAAFQRNACARFTLTRLLSGGDGEPLKDPTEFMPLLRDLSR